MKKRNVDWRILLPSPYKGKHVMSMDFRIQTLAELDTAIAVLRKTLKVSAIRLRLIFTRHGYQVTVYDTNELQLSRNTNADLCTAINRAIESAQETKP
jgi:hypothetical protein